MSDECIHADAIRDVTPSALGCEECLKTGSPWVHLRLCRTCGHVGCCDDSPNRHATKHFHADAPSRSSKAMTRPRAGGGVTLTRSCSTSAIAPPHTTARSRAFTELAAKGVCAYVQMRLTRPAHVQHMCKWLCATCGPMSWHCRRRRSARTSWRPRGDGQDRSAPDRAA